MPLRSLWYLAFACLVLFLVLFVAGIARPEWATNRLMPYASAGLAFSAASLLIRQWWRERQAIVETHQEYKSSLISVKSVDVIDLPIPRRPRKNWLSVVAVGYGILLGLSGCTGLVLMALSVARLMLPAAQVGPESVAYFGGGIALLTWAAGRALDWWRERRIAEASLRIRELVDSAGDERLGLKSYRRLLRQFGPVVIAAALQRTSVKLEGSTTPALAARNTAANG